MITSEVTLPLSYYIYLNLFPLVSHISWTLLQLVSLLRTTRTLVALIIFSSLLRNCLQQLYSCTFNRTTLDSPQLARRHTCHSLGLPTLPQPQIQRLIQQHHRRIITASHTSVFVYTLRPIVVCNKRQHASSEDPARSQGYKGAY